MQPDAKIPSRMFASLATTLRCRIIDWPDQLASCPGISFKPGRATVEELKILEDGVITPPNNSRRYWDIVAWTPGTFPEKPRTLFPDPTLLDEKKLAELGGDVSQIPVVKTVNEIVLLRAESKGKVV